MTVPVLKAHRWIIFSLTVSFCLFLMLVLCIESIPVWIDFLNGDTKHYSERNEIVYLGVTVTFVNLCQLIATSLVASILFTDGLLFSSKWLVFQLLPVATHLVAAIFHFVFSFDHHLGTVKPLDLGSIRFAMLLMAILLYNIVVIVAIVRYQHKLKEALKEEGMYLDHYMPPPPEPKPKRQRSFGDSFDVFPPAHQAVVGQHEGKARIKVENFILARDLVVSKDLFSYY
jgi:hypothetical protein